MPKQVIINMNKLYPFGQCSDGDDQSIKVLVRNQIQWQTQPESLLERVRFFRKLNQTCIIRIEQALEEQESLHLLYQYVPIRMQTWISNINQKFIDSFCRQLIELGQYLAKCYISINLTLQNVGMDQNYRPKYYLDLNFDHDESLNKTTLKNNYHKQIFNLFRPYIQTKIVPKPIRSRQIEQNKGELSPTKSVAVRPKGDNYSTCSTLRLKQKAVALQKQRKNQSINVLSSNWDMVPDKNRKQSILSSVSNVKINRLGKRMEQIKNKLKYMYSPEHAYARHQERSIQKNPNSIAFNWDSTQRVNLNMVRPQDNIQSKTICKTILREMQQQESIFHKFQNHIAKHLTKALPIKKNQSLKAKEYEQMKKSDDGYFKDFFQVLEDKPKQQAIEPSRHAAIEYHPLVREDHQHQLMAQDIPKGDKAGFMELDNRVKDAINKSKRLINRFKGDKN